MRIPLYLAVAQWALLLALGLLVVTAYRQLGRVLGQAAQPPRLGPEAGSRPGKIAYTPARPAPAARHSAEPSRRGSPVRAFVPGGGQPALVAFADPTCPACEQLVTALTQARQAGQLDDLRILLLTSDPPAYLQISAAFQATTLEIGRPLDRADLEPYRPTATPLLVALDAAGTVARAGTAAGPDDVRAFAAACRRPAPEPEALLPVTSTTT